MPVPSENENEIGRLAALAVRAGSPSGRTVLLGAGASVSSGIPTWRGVCELLATKLRLRHATDEDPTSTVKQYFHNGPADSYERFWSLYPEISGFEPSMGYAHLANLIKQGFIGLIITTNWDPLVEIALSRVLRPDQYRVLVRGEVSDDLAARSIRTSTMPTILKLHGDLSARLFHVTDDEMPALSADLKSEILQATKSDLIVVGSSLEDPDLLGLLASDRLRAIVYYVNPSRPMVGSTAHSILRGKRNQAIDGKEGFFDRFFTAFDLSVQRELLSSANWNGAATQAEMISALERGASSVSYQTVAQYVTDFARKIKARRPDVLAFVDDPRAPGGTEIRRRLNATEIGSLPQLQVRIESDLNNRVVNRRAAIDKILPNDEPIKIVLIDSVAFSGNTLKLAVDQLLAAYPMAAVEVAALVASRQLIERSISGHERWLAPLTFQLETDRHDITFPWGSTHSTAIVDRKVGYVDPPRTVQIYRSPWGSGEVFVDQETCSVRVLTVDSGQKLSFQRHLCRDEFFIALDDEVGFDISGHDFADEEIDQFDSRIDAVELSRGDYLLVPRGIWHRARASRTRVRLLQIGLGVYDEEGDIDRLLDNYGRGRSAER